MTREEAIHFAECLKHNWTIDFNDMEEFCDMAIEALSERTGEWVMKEHLWECDQCGCRINRANPLKGNIWNYYFCPNCGADMRGDTE